MKELNRKNQFLGGRVKTYFPFLLVLAFCISCANQETAKQKNIVVEKKTVSQNDIPANGEYRYDLAFAEWGGKSMGEKVTVIIKDNSIKVVYEGDGDLTAPKGAILEEGIIMKHKSGQWIISQDPQDINVDEIGGCTDGPTVIDFENRKFWTC